MLHGNLVLHGWIVGDVTFYTFELPLIAILEFFSACMRTPCTWPRPSSM